MNHMGSGTSGSARGARLRVVCLASAVLAALVSYHGPGPFPSALAAQPGESEHESYPTPVLDDDPFAGTWSGVVREKNGLYLGEAMGELKTLYQAAMKKELDEIERLPEATDVQRRQKGQRLDEHKMTRKIYDTLFEAAEPLAVLLAQVIRVGLPLRFTIVSREFEHYLIVEQLGGMPLEAEDRVEIPTERVGLRTLKIKKGANKQAPQAAQEDADEVVDAPFPNLTLHSPRDNWIREDDGFVYTIKALKSKKQFTFEFRWSFRRLKGPEPGN